MRVTGLRLYPVKSLGGVEVESVVVEPSGFAGDRRWALVDDAGDQVTAREVHQLLRLTAEVGRRRHHPAHRPGRRRVDPRRHPPRSRAGPRRRLPAAVPRTRPTRTSTSGSATGSGPGCDWSGRRIPASRPISGAHGGQPGETMSSPTPDPLLLVSETSMAQLNAWIARTSDAPDVADIDAGGHERRRRPGRCAAVGHPPVPRRTSSSTATQPFAEEGWPGVRIGDVEFRTTRPATGAS